MTFLSPLFLLGALTAVIPVVLHLLKREPEARVKFAAVKLLRYAPVEDAQRRHIREWLLLALRVTSLALLALAFARPLFTSGAASLFGGVTVVALDTSLSLAAPQQFERAKQMAKDAIRRAPVGDLVGVVTFADTARGAIAPTADRALAIAAVDAVTAGFGATHYRAALGAASNMIESHGGARATIVVVTDLQASGWDADDRGSVPESARVAVADVGAPPPNLAVTAARLEGDRVIATVRNAAPQSREAHVRLAVDGHDVSEAVASLGPNQTTEVDLPGARGATASVAVDDPQGIQGDNVRYLVIDNAGRPPVLVVTANGDLARDAFYVQQALAAAGDGAVYQGKAVAGPLAGWDEARLSQVAAVVVLSTQGLEAHARDLVASYVRKGGGLLVAAGADVDGGVIAQFLGGSVTFAPLPPAQTSAGGMRALAPADTRHPIFRAFGAGAAALGLVKFRQITSIAGSNCQTLARFTTGEAALLECASGEGRALVFASDLDNRGNDFPVHATFVPFLHEAVRYLAGGRARGSDYLVGDVPPGVPPRPGIATLVDGGAAGVTRQIAVNVDPNESDPDRLSVDEFQAAVTRLKDSGRAEEHAQASQQENRQHIWQYILLFTLAVLTIESYVGTRTA